MNPRNLSQLIPFLKKEQLVLKKTLSQYFLIDQTVLEKISTLINIENQESVLEIGPGLGCLTKTLLETGAKVTAIEIDTRFSCLLPQIIPHPSLSVRCQDFLTFIPNQLYTVVANIPYHISFQILKKLAQYKDFYTKIFLTVQKEFADKALRTHTKNHGYLSLFVSYFFQAKACFSIRKESFYPRPAVDATLLQLIPKKNLPFQQPQPFLHFVQSLLQKKRKMLRSIVTIPKHLPIQPTQRAESLDIQALIQLFASLEKTENISLT